MALATSTAGVKAIQSHEGLVLETYVDPVGILTIGWGHTGKYAVRGAKITKAKALEILKLDIGEAEAIVKRHVKVPLTQKQFDALTSFVLNVGPGRKGVKDGFVTLKNGRTSTMLRKLNEGDYLGAAAEFPKWASGGGRKLNGLVTRRAGERATFLEGTVVEDQEPMDGNIEAEPNAKPSLAASKPLQVLGASGVAGTLSEASSRLEGVAQYSDYLQILWIALVIAGIGYFIYDSKKGD